MTILERIDVIEADITRLTVDVIVNAANSSLLGGGGVDGAIHRAAGPQLLEECKMLDGCETGSAKITNAYHLSAKKIVHTVGPVWRNGSHHEDVLLASCYRSSLLLADTHQMRSIAFPAISCGAYGFPINRACKIAIHEVLSFLLNRNTSIEKVIFACFNQNIKTALQAELTLQTSSV